MTYSRHLLVSAPLLATLLAMPIGCSSSDAEPDAVDPTVDAGNGVANGNGNGNGAGPDAGGNGVDEGDAGPGDEGLTGEPPLSDASGFAQKGPFREGGTATIVALEADGSRGSDSMSVEVGPWGEYLFEEIDWTGPSLIEVEGEYFDEHTGEFSGETIVLFTVVLITEEQDTFMGNVNLLSHLLARGVLVRMADYDDEEFDDEEFLDMVAAVRDRMRRDLRLQADPRELNLFAQADVDPLIQHESGLLAQLSLGAAAQDDIHDLIAAFDAAWDGNSLTDAFEEVWEAIRDQARSLIEEDTLAPALDAMRAQYADAQVAEPLNAGGGVATIGGCQPTATTEPVPRICLGQTQSELLREGESQMYWFRAPTDGAYRFRHGGEAGSFNVITHIYGSIDDDGEGVGNPRETRTRDHNRAVSTHILSAGDRVYVEMVAAGDAAGEPLEHELTVSRQNEGSQENPVWIFPRHKRNPYLVQEDMEHFVGSQHTSEGENANSQSFYRFISGSEPSVLRYYEFACGSVLTSNGYTSVALYRSNDLATAFDSDNLVDQHSMQDANSSECTVDFELTSGAQYFVRVRAHGQLDVGLGGSMYARTYGPTGSPTFGRAGRTIHFQELPAPEE